ncbi:MAG TPA: TIGR00730 family Rossman fold protein [Xanthomonadaceae bacterium]|nr:TIGR00730 family Rossman fold protein [Xanthomonadaceae bacterium]
MSGLSSIAVFCGAKPGAHEIHREAMRTLGRVIAESGRTLVFGGGRVGLMGVVADAALAAGGRAIGVIPRSMVERELAHTGLTELHVVESMHARKAMMAEMSDAFVACPGGFGTLDEVFEALTWTQIGLQRKPSGFLDVEGFFSLLGQQLDAMRDAGFIEPAHRAMVCFEADPARLIERLSTLELPPVRKEMAGPISVQG